MPAPRYWREMPQRYRLEAVKCTKCGRVCFPPRQVCPQCQSREFAPTTLPEECTLTSYTVIRVPPSEFHGQSPFAVGIVEFAGGGRLTTQVVDVAPEEIKIGMPLRLEFRRIQEEGDSGILCYGYKAVPDR